MSIIGNLGFCCEIQAHSKDIRCLVVDDELGYLYTGSRDGFVKCWLWNSQSNAALSEICSFNLQQWVTGLCVVKSGCDRFPEGCLAVGCQNGLISMLTKQGLLLIHTLTGYDSPVGSICCSGSKLVSGSWNGTVRVWDLNTWECSLVIAGLENSVSVTALPTGGIVAASAGYGHGMDHSLRSYSLSSSEPDFILPSHSDSIRSVTCLPTLKDDDTVSIATVANDGCLNTYRVEPSGSISQLSSSAVADGLLFSVKAKQIGQSTVIATCTERQVIVIWLDTNEMRLFELGSCCAWDVAFDPTNDSTSLIVACSNGTLQLISWDSAHHRKRHVKDDVGSNQLNHDCMLLSEAGTYKGSADGVISYFKAPDGSLVIMRWFDDDEVAPGIENRIVVVGRGYWEFLGPLVAALMK